MDEAQFNMPRPLVLGNGHCLIQFDDRYSIRDLFYPIVGHQNHLGGHPIRMGVWVENQFSWLDSDGWHRQISYEDSTLVGDCVFEHSGLGIRLHCTDALDPVHPCYVRKIRVENLRSHAREVRFFFTHDLRIAETDIGDTAAYIPAVDGIVHYKGKHAFLFTAFTASQGLHQYTTGLKAFKDSVGTWLDAEDGELHPNPISQGSVDSTFSVRVALEANADEMLTYCMVCAPSIEQSVSRFIEWGGRDIGKRIGYARSYWKSWLKSNRVTLFDSRTQEFYERSLLTIRTQIDNGGAILAANDSDIMETNRATYSFVWPRDGALVATILDDAGHTELSQRYHQFCEGLLTPDEPFFRHKFSPDGSLGASWHPFEHSTEFSSPIQEDESALTVWSIAQHFDSVGDIERIARWYPKMIKRICDKMVEFRDAKTGEPKPSWDLWEERFGIHTNTLATICAGLAGGAKLARILGDEPSAERWDSASLEFAELLKSRFWNEEIGAFYRMRHPDGTPDSTLDSSTLAVGLLGALPIDSVQVKQNAQTLRSALWVNSPVGGMARYQGDYYFRRTDDFAGNPWVICTHWLAQTDLMLAESSESRLAIFEQVMQWTRSRATESGILAEQYHPYTGEPLSVSPLTWSHAEVCRTCQLFASLEDCKAVN